MSVAFRRESDEEHKEPRFEIPIPPGPNLVTRRGLRQIEARVEALEAEIAATGDEPRVEALKRDLRYWITRKATAQVTEPPEEDEVGFGSRVTFRHRGAVRTVELVGDDEAEPNEGRIAFSAPLARAMIGGGAGDRVDFGGEADAIEIIATEPLKD